MKIVKFEKGGSVAGGILDGDTVTIIEGWRKADAQDANFSIPSLSMQEISSRLASATEKVALADVHILPPCDPRRKIICVGMNYRDHTAEINHDIGEYPVLFTRSLDSLVAAGDPIIRPNVSPTFDFEGEIAIVIGKPGRHITPENALSHIFGYSCFLDGSVREYQRHSLTAGKNFQSSGAMGPWIVTSDEVAGKNLSLCTRLNGAQVQAATANDMIFDIPTVISYCSRWTTLRAGDVIATGTPGGVGSRRTPPLWMKPGDKVEVEISGVGLLSNHVIAEGET